MQEVGSILRVGFAASKLPLFHGAYSVIVCKRKLVALIVPGLGLIEFILHVCLMSILVKCEMSAKSYGPM